MTSTTSFLGIPVEGDIVRAESRVAQRPLSDLAPLMQAVLDDDGIAYFGWEQYTPYFNDGDPCIFSVGSLKAARPEDGGGEDSEDFDVQYGGQLGSYEGGEWVPDPARPGFNVRVGASYAGPDKARYDRCKALAVALDSGAFDDVLLEAFGDHAAVTVKRDGITVGFYEHD